MGLQSLELGKGYVDLCDPLFLALLFQHARQHCQPQRAALWVGALHVLTDATAQLAVTPSLAPMVTGERFWRSEPVSDVPRGRSLEWCP